MKRIILFFVIIISQFSCVQNSTEDYSPEKFSEEIAKPDVILLDVRTPEEYAEGHLANSINIDFRNENFSMRIDSLDKNKTYCVYCRSGNRSGKTVELMKTKGFSNAHNMTGGILLWEEKKLPVVR